jgi:hypothetical protein
VMRRNGARGAGGASQLSVSTGVTGTVLEADAKGSGTAGLPLVEGLTTGVPSLLEGNGVLPAPGGSDVGLPLADSPPTPGMSAAVMSPWQPLRATTRPVSAVPRRKRRVATVAVSFHVFDTMVGECVRISSQWAAPRKRLRVNHSAENFPVTDHTRASLPPKCRGRAHIHRRRSLRRASDRGDFPRRRRL